MNIDAWDVFLLAIAAWIMLMSYFAHAQYMKGHDTWLFSHKTEIEKKIQSQKIEAITGE